MRTSNDNIAEVHEDDSSESFQSMSSSSSGEDDFLGTSGRSGVSGRRKSRHMSTMGQHGLSKSMVKLHKEGDKAVQRSKYIIMLVLLL